MPRGRRANIGRRTRHASQQQVYSQNLSEERQNIIRENARLRQRVSTRRSLASYNRLAFQYDPTANYSDDENLDIGPMTTICRYCNALKFKRETAGLCCASGKVKLDPLLTPPQPLKPLFDGTDPDSNHFLQHILEYNNCFRMTSFGANIIREGGFMPTCKVKDTTHITNHSHQHNELQHITTTYTPHTTSSHDQKLHRILQQMIICNYRSKDKYIIFMVQWCQHQMNRINFCKYISFRRWWIS